MFFQLNQESKTIIVPVLATIYGGGGHILILLNVNKNETFIILKHYFYDTWYYSINNSISLINQRTEREKTSFTSHISYFNEFNLKHVHATVQYLL